ncbi:unnamed protein product [Owenia fusiformis]|uniref:Uncharacterized protein n=1 Tax=Owenia fusiformis TaxID=6347 RepID=A0A8J1Y1Y5_OWEFU|nr:unnamed protein product [Owenia fusiformis]
MEAPVLSDKQARRSISGKQKRKDPVKNVLMNPYDDKWSPLDDQVQEEILQKMKSTFEKLKLGEPVIKRELRDIKVKKNSKKKQEKTRQKLYKIREWTTEQRQLRGQFVTGINAVTRHLEKGLLQLVIICADTYNSTPIILKHFRGLCSSRKCPAVKVANFSCTLGPLVYMKSVAVIGFKEIIASDSPFIALIDFIKSVAPPITDIWNEHMDTNSEVSINKPTNIKNVGLVSHTDNNDTKQKASIKVEAKPVVAKATGIQHKSGLTSIPSASEPNKNYDYLYIYKEKLAQGLGTLGDFLSLDGRSSKNEADYIPSDFSDSDSDKEIEKVRIKPEIKAEKRKIDTGELYKDVNIKRVNTGPKKIKKVKKKKNKN